MTTLEALNRDASQLMCGCTKEKKKKKTLWCASTQNITRHEVISLIYISREKVSLLLEQTKIILNVKF